MKMAIKVNRKDLNKATVAYSMIHAIELEQNLVELLAKYKKRGIVDLKDIQYHLYKPRFLFFKSDYQRLIPPELKVVHTLTQMTVSARTDEIWIQEYQYNIIKDYL